MSENLSGYVSVCVCVCCFLPLNFFLFLLFIFFSISFFPLSSLLFSSTSSLSIIFCGFVYSPQVSVSLTNVILCQLTVNGLLFSHLFCFHLSLCSVLLSSALLLLLLVSSSSCFPHPIPSHLSSLFSYQAGIMSVSMPSSLKFINHISILRFSLLLLLCYSALFCSVLLFSSHLIPSHLSISSSTSYCFYLLCWFICLLPSFIDM